MGYLNGLAEISTPLVLDTSVLINLNASGYARELLEAIKNPIIVTDVVIGELGHDVRNDRNDDLAFAELQNVADVEIMSVPSENEALYFSLLQGSHNQSLDDGEAATLATALSIGGAALIDEKKALGIATNRFPSLKTAMSFDLITEKNILQSLSQNELQNALYKAVKLGRMRLTEPQIEMFIEIVGFSKAAECTSIPRRFF